MNFETKLQGVEFSDVVNEKDCRLRRKLNVNYMKNLFRIVIFSFVVIILTGCTNSQKLNGLIEENSHLVNVKMKQIEEIVPKMNNVGDSGVIKNVDLINVIAEQGEEGNAVLVHLEDIQSLSDDVEVKKRVQYYRPISKSLKIVEKEYTNIEFEDAKEIIGDLVSLEYLLVLRTDQYVSPEVHSDKVIFDTGYFKGEVLVFEVETGEYLGGFNIEAENSDEVDWRKDISSWLESDLWENIREEINNKWLNNNSSKIFD